MLKRLRNIVNPPSVPAWGTSGVSPLLRNDPPAVEQRAALLAGINISYTLKRSNRRRSIGLRVDDRGLTVCVPVRTSEKWLHSVLQEKADWVLEKLDGWQIRKPAEIRWEDGEKIPYKGELLTLRVEQSLFAAPAHRHDSELRVFAVNGSTAAHIEQTVQRWYRIEAEQLFAERVTHFAQILRVVPREIKLSAAKTQWGSCTPQGSVRLNVQLIKLPPRLIDYVVVHELAHLREMNHSAAFWRVVESACSDYAKLRRELRAFSL
ncbi:MAG TPA: SprT family zinc-dependent metalloprotease [Gallionella sp.]|nr:SprT family zinc-dependent metalloprotease [Gallionella sp.]